MDAARAGGLTQADLARQLRQAGLRATRPRLLVLGLLCERGAHLAADDIVAALAAADEPLQRGTVYNVLGSLVDRGLIAVADAGPGRALYEAQGGWHHHFVCRMCGAVVDIDCLVGQKPCLDARLEGAQIDEAQIVFRGLCARCSRGRRATERAR